MVERNETQHSSSDMTALGLSASDALAIPEGLESLMKRYKAAVSQHLRSEGIAHGAISVFHIEPRGHSFLGGFRLELDSSREIFIYVEPNSRGYQLPGGGASTRGNQPLIIWPYPADPKLLCLGSVVSAAPLGVLFSRLKLSWVPSEVELLTYRPGRRAMVRCSNTSTTAFVKALRPSRVNQVVVATGLAKKFAVPAPKILGWSPAGIVIYERVPGIELSRTVQKISGSEAIKTAFSALSMLEKITTQRPSRTPILQNYSWYFERAIQAHPSHKELLGRLKKNVGSAIRRQKVPAFATTIHGDFHLGQVFVAEEQPDSVTGLIDLDELGEGFPADDVATLWANCLTSRRLTMVEDEQTFWTECVAELERTQSIEESDKARVDSSIAVHLVAQTLSNRGLNPSIARKLIEDAATFLG